MRNLYVSLLFLFGAVQFAAAQTVSAYNFQYKTGVHYEDISSGATTVFGPDADDTLSSDISFFPFTFKGTAYSSLKINEDGLVVLGSALYTPYPYDNYLIQDPAVWGQKPAFPILVAWGEDLSTGKTGNITYKITGTAPYRKLVIQYKAFCNEDFGDTQGLTTATTKNFQIWLSETHNQISFVYGDVIYDWYNNANIGIAASATDYLNVNTATNTVSSTELYMNSYGNSGYTAEPYSKGILPGKGTAYVFNASAIVDEPTAPPVVVEPKDPVAPITASLSMSPEYPVAGQQKYTIYLGYGIQSVTLHTQVSGGNPPATGYTYQWSPSTGLSNAAAAEPVASPQATTTYKVTITDSKGNAVEKAITVYVIDPREGDKYKVCKLGKTTICISINAVETQLNSGATLGDCSVAVSGSTTSGSTVATQSVRTAGEMASGTAVFAAYPNPSAGAFTVQIPQGMLQPTLFVFDASGRLVIQRKAGENQQIIPVLLTEKVPGVYLIKLTANGKVQTGKIIIK